MASTWCTPLPPLFGHIVPVSRLPAQMAKVAVVVALVLAMEASVAFSVTWSHFFLSRQNERQLMAGRLCMQLDWL